MKILQTILILLAVILPLGAESLPVVTLDEALESASENNATLRMQAIALNQTLRSENNYVKDYLPTFGVSISADTGFTLPSATVDKASFNGFGLDLGATASFSYALTGNKITGSASREISKAGASLEYESAQNSIETAVTSSYWTLSTYDIAIENAELSLEDRRESYESTLEMYERGLVDELTMSNVEMALNNAEIALTQARNDKDLAMASFKALTGLSGDFQTEPLPDTVMLSLPSPEELFTEYAENSVSIRTARNNLRNAQNSEKSMTLNQYMPTVSADITYTYGGNVSSKAQMTAAAGEYQDAHSLTGKVAVSIPLSSYIPGSQADENRKAASDAVDTAAIALQSAQDTLLSDIRSSVMSIQQQQSSLGMLESSLTLAQRAYSLAEEAYESGLLSADELSDSRTDLLNAQNSLLSARLGHLLSSYTLADNLGIELQELQDTYHITEEGTV